MLLKNCRNHGRESDSARLKIEFQPYTAVLRVPLKALPWRGQFVSTFIQPLRCLPGLDRERMRNGVCSKMTR